MELKVLLDFDGVLFNSAFEAFSVCNRAVASLPGCRADVGFEEFMAFRAVVTDAWQYHLLYADDRRLGSIAELPSRAPDSSDWAFAQRFFLARAEMMGDPDWPKIMAPYDFFFLLRPLLQANAERFAILSTRDTASIRRTLDYYDADGAPVFGQEDIRRHGSKLAIAEAQGWLTKGRFLCAYVDDMNAHLEPFEGMVHLPLHADWGYDRTGQSSLTQYQIITIISSLLNFSAGARVH